MVREEMDLTAFLLATLVSLGSGAFLYLRGQLATLSAELGQLRQANATLTSENGELRGRVQALEGQHQMAISTVVNMTKELDYWRDQATYERDRAEAYEAALLRNQLDIPTIHRRETGAPR